MNDINITLILFSAFIALASPGPTTLAIAGASMGEGRLHGLALALGVLTGSLFWSISAAFGLAAILYTNAWLFEVLRYIGVGYLLFLAYKSALSAFRSNTLNIESVRSSSVKANYIRGLLIHLTNPKAILFFGALYSVGVPLSTSIFERFELIAMIACLSTTVFLGYALLFSNHIARDFYVRTKKFFDATFSLVFGVAAGKILTSEITNT